MTLSKYKQSVVKALVENESNGLPDYSQQVQQAVGRNIQPTFVAPTQPLPIQNKPLQTLTQPKQEVRPMTAVAPLDETSDFTSGYTSPVKPIEQVQNIAQKPQERTITDFTPQVDDNKFVSTNKDIKGGVDTLDEASYLFERLGNTIGTWVNQVPAFLGTVGLKKDQTSQYTTPEEQKAQLEKLGMDTSKLPENYTKSLAETTNKPYQQQFWEDVIQYEVVKDRSQEINQKYEGQIDDFTKFAGDVSTGALDMLPQTALAYLSGGTSAMAYVFAKSASQSTKQAVSLGAEPEQAKTYGLVMGAIEVGTEMISGGWAGAPKGMGWASKGVMDTVQEQVLKFAKTDLSKKVIDMGMEYLGEGFEEYMSEVLGNYANKIIDQDVKSFGEIQKDAFYAGLVGTFTAMFSQMGQIATVKVAENVVKNDVTTFESLPKEQQLEYAKSVLDKTNTNIVFADNFEGQEVKGEGMFTVKDGQKTIVLPTRMETDKNNLLTVSLMHEFTHTLEQNGEYDNFKSMVIDDLEQTGILDMLRENKKSLYKDENLTDDEIDQEIVATFVQDNIFKRVGKVDGEITTYTDPLAFRKFMKDMGKQDYNAFKKLVNGFLNAYYKGEMTEQYDSLVKQYNKADVNQKPEIAKQMSQLIQQMDLTNPSITKSIEFAFNELANSVQSEVKPTRQTKQMIAEEENRDKDSINDMFISSEQSYENAKKMIETRIKKIESFRPILKKVNWNEKLKVMEWTDSFTAIRLNQDIKELEHTNAGENYPNLERLFPKNFTEKTNIFDRKFLQAINNPSSIDGLWQEMVDLGMIKPSTFKDEETVKYHSENDKVKSKFKNKKISDALDGIVVKIGSNAVEAKRVKEVIDIIGNTALVKTEGLHKPLYFKSELGDALIMPINMNRASENFAKIVDKYFNVSSGIEEIASKQTKVEENNKIIAESIKEEPVPEPIVEPTPKKIIEKDTSTGKWFQSDNDIIDIMGRIDDGDIPQIEQIYFKDKFATDPTDFSTVSDSVKGKGNATKELENVINQFAEKGFDKFKILIVNNDSHRLAQRLEDKGIITEEKPYKYEGQDVVYKINKPLPTEQVTPTQEPILADGKTSSEITNALKKSGLSDDQINNIISELAMVEDIEEQGTVIPEVEQVKNEPVGLSESKVRDENGKLIKVFHGTTEYFSEFDKKKIGSNYIQSKDGGFFFTDNKKSALSYGDGEKIISAYLDFKNPLVIDQFKNSDNFFNASDIYDINRADYLQMAKSENYDGIIINHKRGNLYVAFENKDIKIIPNKVTELKQNTEPVTKTRSVPLTTLESGILTEEQGKVKQRRFETSAIESESFGEKTTKKVKTAQQADMTDYNVISDSSSIEKASKKIANNYNKSYEYMIRKFNDNTRFTKDDIAEVELLAKHFDESNSPKKAAELITNLSIILTESGQVVQAASLVDRLSPAWQLVRLERAKNILQNKYGNELTIDKNLSDELVSIDKNDKEGIKNAVSKITENIAMQLPSSVWNKLDAWRYMSMLLNPKTHVRNIGGNLSNYFNYNVSRVVNTALEKTLPVEQRTHALKVPKEYRSYAEKVFKNNKDTIMQGEKYTVNSEIESQRKIFNNKFGEFLRTGNERLLNWEDMKSMNRSFMSSFSQYLTAQKINPENITPEQLNKAISYASDFAKKVSFREASELATNLKKLESNKNPIVRFAVKSLVPFKNVPINMVKTAYNFSPVGLVTNIGTGLKGLKTYKETDGKSGLSPNQFIERVSNGLTGSGMMLIGALLSSWGVISVGEDEDKTKKENDFLNQLGFQRYSLKVGDYSFDLSFLSPAIVPILMGAEIENQLSSKGGSLLNLGSGFMNTLDPIFEMTMLQGLVKSLNSFGNDTGAKVGDMMATMGSNYIGQLFPTLGGQVAKIIDPTLRTTYAGSDFTGIAQTTINKIMNKTPGLTYNLEPVVNIKGQEVKQSGDWWLRAAQNFLNPSNIKEDITDDVDKEILRLFEKTGETYAIPKMVPNYVTYLGTKYDLSPSERTEFAKSLGSISYNLLKETFNYKSYDSLTDEQKAKVAREVYDYATSASKNALMDSKDIAYTDKSYENLLEADDNGIKPSDYLIMKNKLATIKSTEDFGIKDQFIADLVYSGYTDDEIYRYLIYVGGYSWDKSDQKYIDTLRSVE